MSVGFQREGSLLALLDLPTSLPLPYMGPCPSSFHQSGKNSYFIKSLWSFEVVVVVVAVVVVIIVVVVVVFKTLCGYNPEA